MFTVIFFCTSFPISAYAAESTYVVTQGDTLTKIANLHHTTVQEIMSGNQLTSDKLSIGQTLLVTQTNETLSSSQAMVSIDVLNVREQPSTESYVLTKLSYGTVVQVIEHGPEWSKITLDQTVAYVASPYIIMPQAETTSVDTSTPELASEWTGQLQELVQSLLQTPYILGGTTTKGFDCSGFTAYVYQQLGVSLPRTSEEQFTVGQSVDYERAQPGDLLFYDSLRKGKVSHVALYMGNGIIAHANGDEVRFEKVEYMNKLYPFYGIKRYATAPSNE